MKCDFSLYNLRGGAALAWAQSPTLSLVSQLHAKIVIITLAIDSIFVILFNYIYYIYVYRYTVYIILKYIRNIFRYYRL